MLIRPTAEEAEKYIDFAYELALDPTRSGYPTYTDGIKTKEDFVRNIRRGLAEEKGYQLLLYMEDGKTAGMICFYCIPEDVYLQTVIFNIAGHTKKALEEFEAYCHEHYFGNEMYLGFPGDNQAAIEYLSTHDWTCEDESYNNVLSFDGYELRPESVEVVEVTRENYSDFRKLHEAVQGDMYWNADRLYSALDEWNIYIYYENGNPSATIYCRDCDVLMEIFGVDFKDNQYQSDAFCALVTKVLNECKRGEKKNMVFFGDVENQQDILDMGFRCIGEYLLYVKKA